MFSFLFKRVVPIGRTVIRDSTTQLGFLLQNPSSSLKSIYSKASINQNPFVVSYLISSCGLSPTAAISASKKLGFESSDRPDSVLTLLRDHGFTQAQISSLIRKCPSLLVASPTKTLLPKLEFFHSMGVSSPNLGKILSNDPSILSSSLENRIIPAFNFFKSLLGTVENVVIALKRQARFIIFDIQNVAQNIAILRENGVPESNIVKLLTNNPLTVTPKNYQFKQILEEIKQMGFDPSKFLFTIALHGLTSMNKSTWKRKLETYQRWGFSENEIFLTFKKYPWFMSLSEKKITRHMDFFVNKMGWGREVIIKYPQLLALSLEKRIRPRCSVFGVLVLKGLVKEDHKMAYLLTKSEKHFLEKIVTNYEKEVPQLLDLYKGDISLLGIGNGIEKVCGKKLL